MATKKDEFDDEIRDYELEKADGERILKSLEKIPYQTSRHLCINTGLSIGTVVDWLDDFQLTKEVACEQVGAVRAYYLAKNAPKGKLFLGGDNSVHIRPEEVKPENTGGRKIGEKVVLAPQHRFPEKEKPATTASRAIDSEELRRLASEGLDKRAIAEKLNIKYNRLCYEISNFDKLARALQEGEKEFMQNQTKKEPETEVGKTTQSAQNSSGKALTLKDRVTPDMLEKGAFEGNSAAKFAASLNIPCGSMDFLIYGKNTPEHSAAWKRGKERRKTSLADGRAAAPKPAKSTRTTGAQIIEETKEVQQKIIEPDEKPKHKDSANCSACDKPFNHFPSHIPADGRAICRDCQKNNQPPSEKVSAEENTGLMVDPRFARTLEHISENGHSGEKLEMVKAKLSEPEPMVIQTEIEIIGLSRIKNRGLSVSFDGDFFELPKEKRIILLQMADMKEKFEEDFKD